ncbi:MAG: pilus assembly protein [Anaerolineae bacterium]|nr:pilus assembly protein [Anaerolineae bacterium]
MSSRSPQRGQTLVEFALGAILLFTVVFGIVEFGRVIYAYSVVANSAREGARFAAVNPTGDVAGAAQALAVGVPISVEYVQPTPADRQVVVTVTHQFQPVTPFVPSMTLRSTARQYLEVRIVAGG